VQKLSSIKKIIFIILFFTLSNSTFAEHLVKLSTDSWNFTINPINLEITTSNKISNEVIKLTNGIQHFDAVADVQANQKQAQWYYPDQDLKVIVTTDQNGLVFRFITKKEQFLEWPVAGLSPKASALVIPDGEGLYIPSKDLFWLKEFKKYPEYSDNPSDMPSLLFPFWAVQYNQQYVSYITPENNRMRYAVKQENGQLYIGIRHEFLRRDNFSEYVVLIHLTGNSPISPALDYREWLIKHDKFISLKEKISANSEVKKLLGAFHVWVWGEGKTLPMLKTFQRLGIQHLWLGYDPSLTEKFNVTQEYIELAKNQGYLIGPYDSFDNAQDPNTADNINSIWGNDLWQAGCMRNLDGSIQIGFANRGCYLSSEAFKLREAKEKNIDMRISQLTKFGENSYFVDCDAAEPLYDDYSEIHPMTQTQDKNNRIERMQYISGNRHLVLGSESGLGWANTVIAYNNGSFSTFNEGFWPLLSDKKNFGGWWPDTAPTVLFKPYQASQEFITTNYDPRYRIPLYEAVLHDSVISTDRWELNELKIPAIIQTKTLLESLYNIPAIWVLNIETLQKNSNRFKSYYQFFSPLHQVTALQPLTSFKWLTLDRLVQQTQFGSVLTLTANFSNKTYIDIESMCVKAVWIDSGKSSLYCPEK
jgi:hypothetical protein